MSSERMTSERETDQTATDIAAWGRRAAIPCDPTVRVDENGKAIMDAHFWMGYAARANRYRQTLLRLDDAIQTHAGDPCDPFLALVADLVRDGLTE